MALQDLPAGTFSSALLTLSRKGVRYATAIDVGCADGHFYLAHHELGVVEGAVPFHVDANSVYEPSLKAIQETLGGRYFIGAVSDRDGEIELSGGAHPYWGSVLPDTSAYWEKMNRLTGVATKVQAATLDSLVERFALPAPYLLKLDIQGGELQALRGARATLARTEALIIEVDVDDFDAIHSELVSSGFALFDLTSPNWLGDGSLGWFYPVYVQRARLGSLRPKTLWDGQLNDQVVRSQEARRQHILERSADYLRRLKAQRR